MAVYDAWEMAVAVPIKNHKFRYGQFKGTTLASAATAGNSTLIVNQTSPVISDIVRRGDSIIIGESSNSSYEGKTETKSIKSVSSNTITLNSAISNSYSSGDTVRVYGSKLSGGWDVDDFVNPKGIKSYAGQYSGGKVDNYAQQLQFNFESADFSSGSRFFGDFQYNFSSNPFIEATNYRAGIILKSYGRNISGNCGIAVTVSDGTRYDPTGDIHFISGFGSTVDNSSWTEITTENMSDLRHTALELSGASNGYINVYVRAENKYDFVNMFLDDIYLEHAHGSSAITEASEILRAETKINVLDVLDTSGFTAGDSIIVVAKDNNYLGKTTIQKVEGTTTLVCGGIDWWTWDSSNNQHQILGIIPLTIPLESAYVQKMNKGYYTFTEYPLRSSLAISVLENYSMSTSASNVVRMYYPTSDGDKSYRMKISCRFENVPETMWKKLMYFLNWQRRGSLLNLHPKWDDVPPVMTGFMTISNITKSEHWDLTYRSFNFEFEEAF